MVFNDTTLATEGMIQSFEFWTRMKTGTVTGNLLKQTTARINRGFDRIMPLLLSYSDRVKWDDVNHGDRPIGKINILSGQNDYTLTQDDNELDILNMVAVKILTSSSATDYSDLERLTLDDPRALDAMSPNPSNTGIPTAYVENGNNLFFTPTPNYTATDGIKLFFEREQNYFSSTDTTAAEAGIPKPFQELLVLHAALDWNRVNRTEDRGLINELQGLILRMEQDLKDSIALRNPTVNRAVPTDDSNK